MKKQTNILLLVVFCSFVVLGASALMLMRRKQYVMINGTRFSVELADDAQSRRQGLMFRKSLPAQHGMLFIFDTPEIQRFWMHNTYIPLDIIFIDPDWKIINIVTMPSRTDNTCQSKRPAKYVLELAAESARKYDIRAGQKVLYVDTSCKRQKKN